ncbi:MULTISPECIES: ATP-binding protein [Actinomadura]|uniref:ATP-binding protein n=1 Tax=Actinomadura yumaensis TaxID=111807 RepID=A0ABW2CIG8_9ACTN|nr:ATP-binding protein [Actinomadura sp. J1-007]MWK37222.1 ATP-binding protein [Actinomadura sp. J1-007]
MDWRTVPGDGTPGTVRALLERRLARRELSLLLRERGDDLCLVASELLSNACAETPGREIRVRVTCGDGVLWVGVWDASDVVPDEPAPVVELDFAALDELPEELAVSGRGLGIVRALADEWGIARTSPRGKWVWAVFLYAGAVI